MLTTPVMCTRCICTDRMYGITLNAHGLCSECTAFDRRQGNGSKTEDDERRMIDCFERRKHSPDRGPYDALVSFSGGKDSTYLLYLVKEKFGLNPLACAVIHPFVNDISIRNMDTVARLLGIDMIKFHTRTEIYVDILRASVLGGRRNGMDEIAGCQTCSALYDTIAMKMALRMNIPIFITGTDRTQDLGPQFFTPEELKERILSGKSYGMMERLVKNEIGGRYTGTLYDFNFETFKDAAFPTRIAPFSLMAYDLDRSRRELENAGILSRIVTDSEATNCDVHHFFSYMSYRDFDCHSYARIIAEGIRSGFPTPVEQLAGTTESLGRDIHIAVLDEYRKALFFIAGHPGLEVEDIRRDLPSDYPLMFHQLGEESFLNFFNRMTAINHYIDLFGVREKIHTSK